MMSKPLLSRLLSFAHLSLPPLCLACLVGVGAARAADDHDYRILPATP